MPARFTPAHGGSSARPAPVPCMDVYSTDGTHCYSVPRSAVSHKGLSTDPSATAATNGKPGQDSAPNPGNGPVVCTAYSDLVAKKAKLAAMDPSAALPSDNTPCLGCPLGSRCPNAHVDVPLSTLKSEEVHVHYLWADESAVAYERLIQPMLRDRPKMGSPKEVSNIMLEVFGPNNREPFEMIPAGNVLHTRGARYAFDSAVGTPNRTPSTSRPCHCAHYYFNQICNRGPSCAFIHVVSIDPTQREPCIKAANYHRRIAILAGDHHSPQTQMHSQQSVAAGPQQPAHRSPGTSMNNFMLMGGNTQQQQRNPNNNQSTNSNQNISPNVVNYGTTGGVIGADRNGNKMMGQARDPRDTSVNHGSSVNGHSATMGGNSLSAHSTPNLARHIGGSFFGNSPATHMAADQSVANTRNSPAVSRYSQANSPQHQHFDPNTNPNTTSSWSVGAGGQPQRSVLTATVNNSPSPSANHLTASTHRSPFSPQSNNATPTDVVVTGVAPLPPSPSNATNSATSPLPHLSTTQRHTVGTTPTGPSSNSFTVRVATTPGTPVPQCGANAVPPPPPVSALSPPSMMNVPRSSIVAQHQQQVLLRQQSEHLPSYNAMTLPADDFEDGGEFQQQAHYTNGGDGTMNSNISSASNRFSPRTALNANPANGVPPPTFGSPCCAHQPSMIPMDDAAPYSLNNTTNSNTLVSTSSPRTYGGGSPSVVVGDKAAAAAAAARGAQMQRTNSMGFANGQAPLITVGGLLQPNLLPPGSDTNTNLAISNYHRQNTDGSNFNLGPKRTDSFYSENGDNCQPPSMNKRTPPPHSHQSPHNKQSSHCGNSMYSPEGVVVGMVGVGMGGLEGSSAAKRSGSPQSGVHLANNNSFCNSPSTANHLNSNLVTPKSARVQPGRFTHQPYTPPTAMYGTPMTSMQQLGTAAV